MTDEELAAFLAKGGKVTKCPAVHPDVEPIRPGQLRAMCRLKLREKLSKSNVRFPR